MLIVMTCGTIGLLKAASYRREEVLLDQFRTAVHWIEWELRCRGTDLPALFSRLEERSDGPLAMLFGELRRELAAHNAPDADACMRLALERLRTGGTLRELCLQLGNSLGEFHLEGQLAQLALIRADCDRILEEHRHSGDSRIRSYQTLWVCGGAVLAILLL